MPTEPDTIEADALPDKAHRKMLVRRYEIAHMHETMSQKDIAAALGISRSRVHQLIWDAVRCLKGRHGSLDMWPKLAEANAKQEKLWAKQREESLRLLKEREAREQALRVEQELARITKFYEDLTKTPAWEDAVLYVQQSLGCDRETATIEIIKRFHSVRV